MIASELLMTPPVILVAVMVGFCIGFFGAALMAARARARMESKAYLDGFAACNRAHAEAKYGRL